MSSAPGIPLAPRIAVSYEHLMGIKASHPSASAAASSYGTLADRAYVKLAADYILSLGRLP